MWWRLGVIGLGLLGAASPADAGKLVYYGWGMPDAAYVAAHSAQMEQIPFDGTGIVVPIDTSAWAAGRRDTDNQLGWALFGRRSFTVSDFADTIASLGRVRWRRFTDNFLPAVVNTATQSQGFSWFDDDRWDVAVQNWTVLLKIARRTGCRGVVFDPEDYSGRIFEYPVMSSRHHATFEQYREKVRERGRQLSSRGRHIFPELVVLGLFGPSLPLDVSDMAALEPDRYGLLSAFIDGLVAGGGPGFVFVDGGEYAYTLRSPSQFASLRETMRARTESRTMLPVALRSRLQIGFGLWIDNGGKRRWFPEQPWRNHFTPSGFEDALKSALRATDEYVWVYSQEARFFPPSALPTEYLEAMRRALDDPRSRRAPAPTP